ncbi:hypothetical protein BOTBODRAFT_169033 [Botryobasidium botryosum FD-172 SS1]|uniref:Beta-lactamase-related domain-containing protein n=1 Tax=Botryobasidium botryosum (strain FD-172 SS1) TaxID=930990 RepID=A0A067NCN1_BOTB1|nr:hypothetical protein BOTBODRAFT_169033 [Botryobasidium botryosum FD-172 SS1]
MAVDKKSGHSVYALTPPQPQYTARGTSKLVALAATTLIVLSLAYTKFSPYAPQGDLRDHELQCRAPLPQFLVDHPPSADHPALRLAARNLDKELDAWFTEREIDSIAIAVVASNGSVYEGFRGALRANETEQSKRGAVDRHSIYRLASNSKLFTCLETFILRDRGVVNLDEPLSKILPEFTYTPNTDPITLRQLMSHMSGIGRDWPPGSAAGSWPESLDGSGPPPFNGLSFPDRQTLMDGIADNQLLARPYTLPSYSNTGYALLGVANVAAVKASGGSDAPSTHAELMHRDVFLPLGLNDSSFITTSANKERVVVSSFYPEETDQDFLDVANPAGGQMSSLSDLVKLMQSFIDPSRPESLLRPYTMREWLRPVHAWWDDYSEMGLLWEIHKSEDSYGRRLRHYQKLGNLAGHHSSFTIAPSSSFGVVVLMTGPISQAIELDRLVFSHFQSAFDRIAEERTHQLLVGDWLSVDNSQVEITIAIDNGSLFVTKYIIDGTDVLQTIQLGGPSRKTALWSTGDNEFRLAVSMPDTGCLYQWVALDQYGYNRGFPTNLIRVVEDTDGVTLQVPAIGVDLKRHL